MIRFLKQINPILRALLAAFLALILAPEVRAESIRFRWKEGEIFTYRLKAEVREGEMASSLEGEVAIRALSPTAGILDRQVSSLLQKLKGEPPRAATPTELTSMRVLIPMGPDGGVPGEAGLEGDDGEGVRGFIASLFPFPPGGEASGEKGWEIRIASQGDLLTGEGKIQRKVQAEGHPCLEIRFQAASPESGRELEGTALFSSSLGAFLSVEREIRSPGPPERRETLSLLLRRHPGGPVLDPEYRKELEIAREATERDGENPVAWARLAAVLQRGGSGQEALAAIRKAAALEPGEVSHRILEGQVLGMMGRLEEARKTFSGVLADHPGEGTARLHLSRILYQEGRYAEAADAAEAALQRDPTSTDGMFLLGVARAKLGDLAEAKALVQKSFGPREDEDPPTVTFDGDGNLRLVIPRPAWRPAKRPPLTPEEREAAEQILKQIVSDEARKQEMSTDEIDRVMEYIASACGTDPPGMIAEFLEQREATARRIARSLEKRREIPLEKIRKLAGSEDGDLRLGAAFYLPLDEAVPLIQGVIKEDPAKPGPYLHLAAVILREPGGVARHGEVLMAALRTGGELDPQNGIYGYLAASIHLDRGETILALEKFTGCLGRPAVATGRPMESRLRKRVLREVGFDPVFRGAVAWGVSASPFPEHVGRAARGVIAFARKLEQEGKDPDALSFLESVLLCAAQLRDTADEVRIILEAGKIELEAVKALVEMDGRVGDEEALKVHQEWKAAAMRNGVMRLRAAESFQALRDEALHFWPITDPARYRKYMRQALAGERRIYEEHLREASRAGGGAHGD